MTTTEQATLRISLPWLLLATLVLFGIGLLGGMAGQYFFAAPVPLFSENGDQIITTTQEVTISPNTTIIEVVQRLNRSIVGLVRESDPTNTLLGSGFVMTNDGLVVSTLAATDTQMVAIDDTGQRLSLDRVGNDELFGLAYYRLPANVVVPLDVSQDNPTPGQVLQTISRAQDVPGPTVAAYTIANYLLPAVDDPRGWQQLMQGTRLPETLSGAALVDENGRVSGILVTPQLGIALPMRQLTESFNRILNNRREVDPLADFGFSVAYQFVRVTPESPLQFVAVVTNVTPGSPAGEANLVRRDIITAINDTNLSWDQSFINQLGQSPRLTILRDKTELRLILAN